MAALEVVGTRVEGAVLVVQLRPTMKAPGLLKTGTEDIAAEEKQRTEHRAAIEAAEAEAAKAKQEAAAQRAFMQRKAHWNGSMKELQLSAARRQATATATKLAQERERTCRLRWQDAKDVQEKRHAKEELAAAKSACQDAVAAQKAAEEKASKAAKSEQRALQAVKETQARLKQTSVQLHAQYGSAQFFKGLARAKEVVRVAKQQEKEAVTPAEAQAAAPAAAPAAEEAAGKPKGEQLYVMELVEQLKASTGPRESWPREKPADSIKQANIAGQTVDRIADVCFSSKANRKAAASAGVFEELSMCLTKYSDRKATKNMLSVQLRCARALEAITKKAEKEEVQEEAGVCIFPLAESLSKVLKATPEMLEGLAEPGILALRTVTKNHRENTLKLQRAGGLAGWLDDASSIVPPNMPEKLK